MGPAWKQRLRKRISRLSLAPNKSTTDPQRTPLQEEDATSVRTNSTVNTNSTFHTTSSHPWRRKGSAAASKTTLWSPPSQVALTTAHTPEASIRSEGSRNRLTPTATNESARRETDAQDIAPQEQPLQEQPPQKQPPQEFPSQNRPSQEHSPLRARASSLPTSVHDGASRCNGDQLPRNEPQEKHSQDPVEASIGGRPKEQANRNRVVNVKDRIKAIEESHSSPTKSDLPLRSTRSQAIFRQMDGLDPDEGATGYRNGSGSRHGVPLVFPLHVRKFHRRRSNGSPWRAETPLYRSDPDQETDIQSPLPQRTIPIVRVPSETSTNSPTLPPADLTPPCSPGPALKYTHPKATTLQSRQLVNPFVHFHGTRSSCVRHGRKSGLGKPKPSRQRATKDMFERSRSGAYIPVGFNALKQLEATSPWAFANSTTRCTELTCLTIEATKDDEDACPDCVAELGIKRRDMEKAVSDWSDTAFPDHEGTTGSAAAAASQVSTMVESFPDLGPATLAVDNRPLRHESWRSTVVEPADSESEAGLLTTSSAFTQSTRSNTRDVLDPDDAVVRIRKRSRTVRFNSFSQEFECDAEPGLLVVSRDLGEDLDAVILERGGTVEKVITNTRDQTRTSKIIAKISRELAQIASTLSSGQLNERQPPSEDKPAGRTAVVDGNSDAEAGRASLESSVPELLQLINEAANELQPGLIRKPTCERAHGGHAWLDQSSANDFATEFKESFTALDQPQTLEEAEHVSGTSAAERVANRQRLDEDYRALKDHQLANTQHDHDLSFLKTHRRSIRSSTPLTASTFYASRPSSSPIQNLGSPEIPITVSAGEPVLPSHVLRSQDFLCVPTSTPSPRPLFLGSPLIPSIRLEQGSPCIFTDSTAPSLTASAANSAQTTPQKETPKTLQLQQEPMTSTTAKEKEKYWGSPSEVRANSQAIRHVMRMEKMSAVQEAAAMERAARRQKMVEGEAKRALE